MRALRYAFDEAIVSLWRGRRSGILSTATIAVALFVLGAFLMATSNLERLGDEWGRSAEMSVYLADDASAENRQAVEALLVTGPLVAGHEFVTKEEALRRFKATFADLASAVETVEGNPLPASYEVRLQAAPGAKDAVAQLADRRAASEPAESDPERGAARPRQRLHVATRQRDWKYGVPAAEAGAVEPDDAARGPEPQESLGVLRHGIDRAEGDPVRERPRCHRVPAQERAGIAGVRRTWTRNDDRHCDEEGGRSSGSHSAAPRRAV